MADFKIQIDEWLDATDVRSPELRETWCRLRILLDGKSLIELHDQATQSVRTSLYLPAYVLAEWFVDRSIFHVHEYSRVASSHEPDYAYRHNLKHNREGYLFPELTIEPKSDSLVVITLRKTTYPVERKEFILEEQFYCDRVGFEAGVQRFIDTVLSRLEDRGVGDTYLSQRWSEISHADREEKRFISAMASMGVHYAELSDAQTDTFLAAYAHLPEAFSQALLRHLTFNECLAGVENFERLWHIIDKTASEALILATIRKELWHEVPPDPVPWRYGYALAKALRTKLGMEREAISTPDDIDRHFGTLVPRMETDMLSPELTTGLRALIYADTESPRVQFGMQGLLNPVSGLFNYCRALGEYLIMGTSKYSFVSKIDSWDQQTNRAFAAEFLLPATLLRERTDAQTIPWSVVDEFARLYNVSSQVVLRQLENQTSIRLEEE